MLELAQSILDTLNVAGFKGILKCLIEEVWWGGWDTVGGAGHKGFSLVVEGVLRFPLSVLEHRTMSIKLIIPYIAKNNNARYNFNNENTNYFAISGNA